MLFGCCVGARAASNQPPPTDDHRRTTCIAIGSFMRTADLGGGGDGGGSGSGSGGAHEFPLSVIVHARWKVVLWSKLLA